MCPLRCVSCCRCCVLVSAVQSHVVGVYALHASLGACGAPQLLAHLDDAVSDTMRECGDIHNGKPRPVCEGSGRGVTHNSSSRVCVLRQRQGRITHWTRHWQQLWPALVPQHRLSAVGCSTCCWHGVQHTYTASSNRLWL